VMLGKLLATPLNLLLLDEPTNHLDMDACDALIAAIDSFDGTVIMVTHNEMFLDALANRLIVFQNDAVYVFEGTYQRFLEKGGWEMAQPPEANFPEAEAPAEATLRLTKKEMRRLRSEIIAERSKAVKPIEDRIKAAEKEIEETETRLDALNAAMLTASQAQQGERIGEIGQQIHVCQTLIDQRFAELEPLYKRLEEQEAIFKQKLQRLE
jgi:ATP-binding cassette subfamily F protein 3